MADPLYRSGVDNSVIHFTARGQRIMGRRYHAAYLFALANVQETVNNDGAPHWPQATPPVRYFYQDNYYQHEPSSQLVITSSSSSERYIHSRTRAMKGQLLSTCKLGDDESIGSGTVSREWEACCVVPRLLHACLR